MWAPPLAIDVADNELVMRLLKRAGVSLTKTHRTYVKALRRFGSRGEYEFY